MFHLASMPTPASPPSASHQRGSELVSSLVTASSAAAQQTKSTGVVVSSCIAPRYSAQHAVAIAASSWPPRPAPSARAIAAVSSTSAASPSAGSARRPTSVFPVSMASSRASSGVSAGWSTYPHARCRPEARKYSSSRTYPYRPLTAISTPKAAAATSQTALFLIALVISVAVARGGGRRRRPARSWLRPWAPGSVPPGRSRVGRTDELASPAYGRWLRGNPRPYDRFVTQTARRVARGAGRAASGGPAGQAAARRRAGSCWRARPRPGTPRCPSDGREIVQDSGAGAGAGGAQPAVAAAVPVAAAPPLAGLRPGQRAVPAARPAPGLAGAGADLLRGAAGPLRRA